jgi:1-acyl-sn-glycerol-3-phosphate acyltransferase
VIYVLRYGLIAFHTAFWAGLACLASPLPRSGEMVRWISESYMRSILWSCGVTVEAAGLENLRADQPYVFMSNHRSVFDIAAMVVTNPTNWRFVAKKELVWIPIFGWAMALAGHIIVDRSNRARSVRSLERAAERVRGGLSVIIFPEGTRSRTREMGPFKSGGFHLAIQAGVPIVPVSIWGSDQITPKSSLRIESGSIGMFYGKPIATESLAVEDRGALKEEVRQTIQQGLAH